MESFAPWLAEVIPDVSLHTGDAHDASDVIPWDTKRYSLSSAEVVIP